MGLLTERWVSKTRPTLQELLARTGATGTTMQPVDQRPAAPTLLSYRPWRGTFRGPAAGMWAIARVALFLLLRRWLFWGLYALAAMIFLFFFYGQYLQTWIGTQLSQETINFG